MNSIKIFVLGLILFTQCNTILCQNTLPDTSYFQHWEGEWYQEIDGKLAAKPRFVVKQALYPSSFEESWVMEDYMAKAWRVWDSRSKKWDFAWMSDNGLFQLWEGLDSSNKCNAVIILQFFF